MKLLLPAVTRKPSSVILSTLSTVTCLLLALPVSYAADAQVPWECSNYEGAAQTRCLNAFIDLQREKIGQLEGQLQAQQGTVNQLKEHMDRQSAATADLQRQLSDRSSLSAPLAPYAYSYIYPPAIGLGLSLGRPWNYGYPYYFRPYGGPRYYRHWGHGR